MGRGSRSRRVLVAFGIIKGTLHAMYDQCIFLFSSSATKKEGWPNGEALHFCIKSDIKLVDK